jgi:zinc finger SWIM domain-containing protein 3
VCSWQRGPEEKLKSVSDKDRATVTCTLCKGKGHNRRTCSLRKEVIKSNVHEI